MTKHKKVGMIILQVHQDLLANKQNIQGDL